MFHKIHIAVPNGRISDLAIDIDGKPLDGVTHISFQADANEQGLSKLVLTMFADVTLDIEAKTVREYTLDSNSGEFVMPPVETDA